MKIESYKQNPEVEKHYDTIIVGSGMGSLATASILAKEGKKVLILERHYTAGGFTHIFKRKNYEWDVGIHYIGEVQRPDSLMKKSFDYVSNGKLKWEDMGTVYDRIIIGDKTFEMVKGVQNFKSKMVSYFPEEQKAIDKYVDFVFAATKTSKKFYMDKALPSWISMLFGPFLRRPFYKFSDRTTYDVLSSITKNEDLIKVLTGQYGDYGLPPKRSSFAMHASLVRHYFSGGSFPVGGSSQIVKKIFPIIKSAGGTILINVEVDKIIIENNKAKGVRMKDGKSFFADNTISNAGFMTTYKKLIPKEIIEQHHLNEQLQKVDHSVAHACLYVGLNESTEELKLPKSNYWIYPDDSDHDSCVDRYLKDINEPFPVVYISFPSAKDPDWSNRFEGKSTIEIITLIPFEIFEAWSNTKWMKRGEEYLAIKEKISKRLLEELYKQVPQVKGKIDYYELFSPLSTKHFVNYEKGEIYGIDHSPGRFRQKFLKPRTPIKNFYLTGQDIVTAGVGGALFSGILTTSALTGKNIIKKIMASK